LCLFEAIIEKVLSVTASLANHPAVPEVTLSQLTYKSKAQRTVKKQNLITVHILTLRPVLICQLQFRYKTNTKIFQHKRSYCYSKCVSSEAIILLLIFYRFIFGSILLSQFHGRYELLQAEVFQHNI